MFHNLETFVLLRKYFCVKLICRLKSNKQKFINILSLLKYTFMTNAYIAMLGMPLHTEREITTTNAAIRKASETEVSGVFNQ